MAGIFQPTVEGPQGSAIQPRQPTTVDNVTPVLSFVESAGKSFFSYLQADREQQAKIKSSVALTAFTKEMSTIADAAEQGMDPARARTAMRAVFNKHAANNPLLLSDMLDLQKKYGESQMGEAIDKGSIAYQEEQRQRKELADKSIAAGFTDPEKFLKWEATKRGFEVQDQRMQIEMHGMNMKLKQAQLDKAQREALLAEKKTLEIDQKNLHNEGILKNLSTTAGAMQDGLQNIVNSPASTQEKIDAVHSFFAKYSSDYQSRFYLADNSRLTSASGVLKGLEEAAIDSITQGKVSQHFTNQVSLIKNSGALNLMSQYPEFAALGAGNAVAGVGFTNFLTSMDNESAGNLIRLSIEMARGAAGAGKPGSTPTATAAPPVVTPEVAKAATKLTKDLSGSEDHPSDTVPSRNIVENMTANTLRSVIVYGPEASSKEDLESAMKYLSGPAYDALKKYGWFNIDSSYGEKFSKLIGSKFENSLVDIKNEFYDVTYKQYSTPKETGNYVSVESENVPLTRSIEPVVENGVFKFKMTAAETPQLKAEEARLNKTLAPKLQALVKMYAVAKGDPDLNKAWQEMAPKIFPEE